MDKQKSSKATKTQPMQKNTSKNPQCYEKILEEYEVIELLGEGSMGKVFKVRNRNIDRIETLKMLKNDDNQELMRDIIARFQREIKTVAALKREHPHVLIPEIFASKYNNDCFYYTMEFVEGTTLYTLIANKNISMRQAIEISIKLTKILEVIHAEHILHRDIKPRNVVVDRKGQVWLLDFGVLKKNKDESIRITKAGLSVGTPRYMSPEQATGEKIGPSSDLYSVGAILYEMLTFEKLVKEKTVEKIFDEIFSGKKGPTPPSKISEGVPIELDNICLKLVAKDKKQRYQSATELRRELEQYLRSLKKIKFSKRQILILILILVWVVIAILQWNFF